MVFLSPQGISLTFSSTFRPVILHRPSRSCNLVFSLFHEIPSPWICLLSLDSFAFRLRLVPTLLASSVSYSRSMVKVPPFREYGPPKVHINASSLYCV